MIFKNKKHRRNAFIVAGIIEAVIIIFCLTISIIVVATSNVPSGEYVKVNGPFIGAFQVNSTLFLCTILLPLILIFVVDGLFAIYVAYRKPKSKQAQVAKSSSVSEEEKARIIAEAKAQARAELEAELKNKENKE